MKPVRRSNFGNACGSGRSTTKAIVTLLLLLPSYHCHNCTWPLLFNDDVDHRHKKSQKKERDMINPREIMFNDLSLRFEGVEDHMRKEMVVMELNN